MTALDHRLDRTIVIEAPQAAVFKYFTDPARWAAWWGAGSTIDARPGGRVLVRYPDGTEAAGEVVEVRPPTRIVFTYGYVKGEPFAPGESVVTIELEPAARGTRLRLAHAFADAGRARSPRAGLALPAVALRQRRRRRDPRRMPRRLVDAWFGAWAETDEAARTAALAAIASADVRMHDRFSCIEGRDELMPHIGAAQQHMPGMRLQRSGDPRHCQGTVLAGWTAVGPGRRAARSGHERLHARSGRAHRSVTGFWG